MVDVVIAYLTAHKDLIAACASLVTIFGVPVGIVLFLLTKREERRANEYEAYHALDDKYAEFQRICLQHPNLDVHDIPLERREVLTEAERRQELAAFSILFSIFERAYLMYARQSRSVRRVQWTGWEDYILHHLRRGSTRAAWRILTNTGGQFDATFTKFVNTHLRNLEREGIEASALPKSEDRAQG